MVNRRLVLDFQQKLLSRESKLYVRASMNCAQANTSSMLGIKRKNKGAHHGQLGHGPKKRERFYTGRHFSGIVGKDSGTCKCKMSFCRDNWAKHDTNSSTVRSCDSTPSGKCFSINQGEYTRQCRWPNPEHYLFRVLWFERWEDADIWIWKPAREISDLGPKE